MSFCPSKMSRFGPKGHYVSQRLALWYVPAVGRLTCQQSCWHILRKTTCLSIRGINKIKVYRKKSIQGFHINRTHTFRAYNVCTGHTWFNMYCTHFADSINMPYEVSDKKRSKSFVFQAYMGYACGAQEPCFSFFISYLTL